MAEPRYRWVVVAAGAVMGCIALGAMFSLPCCCADRSHTAGPRSACRRHDHRISRNGSGKRRVGRSERSNRSRLDCLIGALLLVPLELGSMAPTLAGFQLAFGLLVVWPLRRSSRQS